MVKRLPQNHTAEVPELNWELAVWVQSLELLFSFLSEIQPPSLPCLSESGTSDVQNGAIQSSLLEQKQTKAGWRGAGGVKHHAGYLF